jgi:hypothetical protein
MLTGVYAARNVVGERHDVWAVNTEMEYHEGGRAESPARGDRLVPARVELATDAIIDAVFAKLDPVALGVAVGTISGLALWLVMAVALLGENQELKRVLLLLGQYLIGFRVTWGGAAIGLVEAGLLGFALGSVTAWLRNWGMAAYAALLRRRAESEEERDLLDRI